MSKICNRLSLLLCLGYLISLPVNASQDYDLSIDKYYSPYMGANWMISGMQAYKALDDNFLVADADFPLRTTCKNCVVATLARSGKFLLDFTLSNLAMVTQHEVFGHGARAREFHLANVSYHINFFHGTTYFSSQGFNQLNVVQQAALSAGGMEATSILAGKMQQNWMYKDKVEHRDATLYLVNSLDQSTYVFGTTDNEFHADNDVQAYISQVNQWHGGNVLSLDQLKNKIIWDWLDPMLYVSVASIYNYIACGQSTTSFGTLHIGEQRFMPTTRTWLTPWGPEFQLQNHFVSPANKYLGIFLRTGRTGGVNSYGADLLVTPLAQFEDWELGNKLSFWYQPHIIKNTTAATNKNKMGFAEFITASYDIAVNTKSYLELGYKTSGYLPGTQLTRGVIWRVGFKFEC